MTSRVSYLVAGLLGAAVILSQAIPASAQVRPAPKADKPGAKAKDQPMTPKAKPQEPPRVTRKPPAPDAKDDAKDRAKDAKDDAKDRAKDVKGDAKDRAKDTKDDAKDRAKDAKDDVKDRAKDTRDDVKDRAKDAKDDVKDRAKDTKDDVKDRAKDTRDDVKDRAKDAKDDAKERAKGFGDDVRDRPKATGEGAKDRGNAQAKKFDASKVKAEDVGLTFKEADKGLQISNIERNSVLASSGFQTGDQIVSINGQSVARQADFFNYLFAPGVTGRVPVVYLRDGVRDTVYLRPTTIIRDYERVVVDDRNPIRDFGLVLDGRNDGRLIVDRVIRDSRADHAGIKVDDEILAVNDRDVDSRDELARMLDKYEGEPIDMEVRRDRTAKVLEVKVLR